MSSDLYFSFVITEPWVHFRIKLCIDFLAALKLGLLLPFEFPSRFMFVNFLLHLILSLPCWFLHSISLDLLMNLLFVLERLPQLAAWLTLPYLILQIWLSVLLAGERLLVHFQSLLIRAGAAFYLHSRLVLVSILRAYWVSVFAGVIKGSIRHTALARLGILMLYDWWLIEVSSRVINKV